MTRKRASALNAWARWWAISAQAQQNLWNASYVASNRMGRLARAGSAPGADDAREFTLMWSEKVDAANRSALAIAQAARPGDFAVSLAAFDALARASRAYASLASSKSFAQLASRQAHLASVVLDGGQAAARAATRSAALTTAAMQPFSQAVSGNASRLAARDRRTSKRR